MKGFRTLLTILIIAFTVQFTNAQDVVDTIQKELSLDKGSIESQFEYVFKKSGNYRAEGIRYEVVKVTSLEKLRKNVADSINGHIKNKATLKSTINAHETTISSLNKKLEETTNNLTGVTEEKDNMSFLGISVSKGLYNTILWSIILALLGLMLLFLFQFRKSNTLTQEAKSSLSELEGEYEDHRRRALEREQKINRQLQDELNKQKKSK